MHNMLRIAAFVILATWFGYGSCANVVQTFYSHKEGDEPAKLNHLVVDKLSGHVYVGAVNNLYHLTKVSNK